MAAKERSIYRIDLARREFKPLELTSAASLGTKERDIENFLVTNPGLLFTEPDAVLIIGQEVGGESIADVLAKWTNWRMRDKVAEHPKQRELPSFPWNQPDGLLAELADAMDSKSIVQKT